jgi:hypothetical protein
MLGKVQVFQVPSSVVPNAVNRQVTTARRYIGNLDGLSAPFLRRNLLGFFS